MSPGPQIWTCATPRRSRHALSIGTIQWDLMLSARPAFFISALISLYRLYTVLPPSAEP